MIVDIRRGLIARDHPVDGEHHEGADTRRNREIALQCRAVAHMKWHRTVAFGQSRQTIVVIALTTGNGRPVIHLFGATQ